MESSPHFNRQGAISSKTQHGNEKTNGMEELRRVVSGWFTGCIGVVDGMTIADFYSSEERGFSGGVSHFS